jgi:hypothetical protein
MKHFFKILLFPACMAITSYAKGYCAWMLNGSYQAFDTCTLSGTGYYTGALIPSASDSTEVTITNFGGFVYPVNGFVICPDSINIPGQFINGSIFVSGTGTINFVSNTMVIHYTASDGVNIDQCTSTYFFFPTTVKENLPADRFRISPNPFHSTFTIHSSPVLISTTLSIYNTVGEKVFSTVIKDEEQGIEVNAVPGIYFMEAGGRVQKLVMD